MVRALEVKGKLVERALRYYNKNDIREINHFGDGVLLMDDNEITGLIRYVVRNNQIVITDVMIRDFDIIEVHDCLLSQGEFQDQHCHCEKCDKSRKETKDDMYGNFKRMLDKLIKIAELQNMSIICVAIHNKPQCLGLLEHFEFTYDSYLTGVSTVQIYSRGIYGRLDQE